MRRCLRSSVEPDGRRGDVRTERHSDERGRKEGVNRAALARPGV